MGPHLALKPVVGLTERPAETLTQTEVGEMSEKISTQTTVKGVVPQAI